MIKKIWTIFLRDLKVNTRDFLALYILVIPIILAFGINLLTPSINNTSVNLALIEGDNAEQVAYLEDFANVELFKDMEAIEERVGRRDNIIGILPDGDDYYVLQQGNETEEVVDYAKMLLTFYEEDVQIANSNAEIIDFGRTVPPFKKMLVNIMILMISVLGGMLIALNIVEEKVDRTIRAIHLSPVSRKTYILGKSIMGIFLPVYGTIAVVLITGFSDINYFQMLFFVLVSTVLSLLVGFIEGLNNDDVISAAANIKILFLPVAASVVAVEILSAKWQILFYWIPFYWAYKGNDAILSGTASWQQILLYSIIIIGLSAIVYIRLAPKIRKGLE
ncbi:MAG: ABC transporter permease [Eubacteriaceae bacterium]